MYLTEYITLTRACERYSPLNYVSRETRKVRLIMAVRCKTLTPLNKPKGYSSGEGGTLVQQEDELKAKMQLVVGNTFKASESILLPASDYACGFAKNSGQDYAIGVINMQRAGTAPEPPTVYATVEVEYMSTSFLVANTNLITTTANPLTAFLAVYHDGGGVGGYAFNLTAPSFYKIGRNAP